VSDPLTDIVALLNPRPTHTKLVEGAGKWRILRESVGEAFYCAVLQGECLMSINGKAPTRLVAGDFVLIPATYTFENTSAGTSPPEDITEPNLLGDGHVRIGSATGEAEFLMNVGHCEFDTPDKQLIVALLPGEILIKGQRRFVTLFELLLDESRTRRPGRDAVMTHLLQLILVESLRSDPALSRTAGILKGLQHEKSPPRCISSTPIPALTGKSRSWPVNARCPDPHFSPYSARQWACLRGNTCCSGECR